MMLRRWESNIQDDVKRVIEKMLVEILVVIDDSKIKYYY